VGLAALAAAQTDSERGGRMRQRMMGNKTAVLGMHDLRIAADLNLTADQQTKIRAAFEEAAPFRKGG